ncbi:MAG: type II toxin-antitoxin system RelE/ParE family toxin [Betaproteobacteria bacterium]|nr:type II toxin-antitoxin system RelE/ParE family toxin [Betaproteobacteria bacterium]
MRILWTDEALIDLEEILAYYYLEASQRVAEAVEKRIVGEVEALLLPRTYPRKRPDSRHPRTGQEQTPIRGVRSAPRGRHCRPQRGAYEAYVPDVTTAQGQSHDLGTAHQTVSGFKRSPDGGTRKA